MLNSQFAVAIMAIGLLAAASGFYFQSMLLAVPGAIAFCVGIYGVSEQ
jgi:hypothetical protein